MKKSKIGTALIIVSISISVFTLFNHLLEVKTIKECAATPGCMYCIPFWSIASYAIYFVCIVLLIIGIVFLKPKKNNESV